MSVLIEGLLRLSDISSQNLRFVPVDITHLSQQILQRLAAANFDQKTVFFIALDILVYGDPILVEVAMNNLLKNAWKFTRKTSFPCIETSAAPGNGPFSFLVRENGVGFDISNLHSLFNSFYRSTDFTVTNFAFQLSEGLFKDVAVRFV